jgi:hypothetical protein
MGYASRARDLIGNLRDTIGNECRLLTRQTTTVQPTRSTYFILYYIINKMRRSNSNRPSTGSRSQTLLGNTTVTGPGDDITSYLDESSANLNELVQSRTAIGERDREIAKVRL